jgi:hypothetical protein
MTGFRDDFGNNVEMEVEQNGAGVTIDTWDRKINEGKVFGAWHAIPLINAQEYVEGVIVTGSKKVYLRMEVEAFDGEVILEFGTDNPATNTVDELLMERMNETIEVWPETKLYVNSVLAETAKQAFFVRNLYASVNAKAKAKTQGHRVLNPNKTYYARLESKDMASRATFYAQFYEGD